MYCFNLRFSETFDEDEFQDPLATINSSSNYFDLPSSYFPPSSLECTQESDDQPNKQTPTTESGYGRIMTQKSDTPKFTSLVEEPKNYQPITTQALIETEPAIKVNLPSNLKTSESGSSRIKKSMQAPPPPRPLPPQLHTQQLHEFADVVKKNKSSREKTTAHPHQQTPRSSSSTGFHRVLNRIVESGIHVNKSKTVQEGLASPTKTQSSPKIDRFEPINGYESLHNASSGRKEADGHSTISKGLNKLKFYRKSYSVSNSLPSRNFNIKALIDKLNSSNSSSKAKVRLENSLKTSNGGISGPMHLNEVKISEPLLDQETSLRLEEKLGPTRSESVSFNPAPTSTIVTTKPFAPIITNPTNSINRIKSFSVYNNAAYLNKQVNNSDGNITNLFNNQFNNVTRNEAANNSEAILNGPNLTPPKILNVNGSIVKLKTSKSFNFVDGDFRKNKIITTLNHDGSINSDSFSTSVFQSASLIEVKQQPMQQQHISNDFETMNQSGGNFLSQSEVGFDFNGENGSRYAELTSEKDNSVLVSNNSESEYGRIEDFVCRTIDLNLELEPLQEETNKSSFVSFKGDGVKNDLVLNEPEVRNEIEKEQPEEETKIVSHFKSPSVDFLNLEGVDSPKKGKIHYSLQNASNN